MNQSLKSNGTFVPVGGGELVEVLHAPDVGATAIIQGIALPPPTCAVTDCTFGNAKNAAKNLNQSLKSNGTCVPVGGDEVVAVLRASDAGAMAMM